MCILGFWWVGKQYALTARYLFAVVNNRDEFLSRPTSEFFVDKLTSVACCRDGTHGGTWMALNLNTRRFAALTNSRGDSREGTISRGKLVIDYVQSVDGPSPHDDHFSVVDFDGFNFVSCADLGKAVASAASSTVTEPPLLYTTNRHDCCRAREILLGDSESSYAVANTYFGNYSEPKTRFIRDKLVERCTGFKLDALTPLDAADSLGDLLKSQQCDKSRVDQPEFAGDNNVLDTRHNLGYGTRTQSVILVERSRESQRFEIAVHYFVRDVHFGAAGLAFGEWQHAVSAPMNGSPG